MKKLALSILISNFSIYYFVGRSYRCKKKFGFASLSFKYMNSLLCLIVEKGVSFASLAFDSSFLSTFFFSSRYSYFLGDTKIDHQTIIIYLHFCTSSQDSFVRNGLNNAQREIGLCVFKHTRLLFF